MKITLTRGYNLTATERKHLAAIIASEHYAPGAVLKVNRKTYTFTEATADRAAFTIANSTRQFCEGTPFEIEIG